MTDDTQLYAGMEAALGIDLANIFANSEVYRHTQNLIEAQSVPMQGTEPLSFHTQYACSSTDQVKFHNCVVPPRTHAQGKRHLCRGNQNSSTAIFTNCCGCSLRATASLSGADCLKQRGA